MGNLISLKPAIERKKAQRTPLSEWIKVCEMTCGLYGDVIPVAPVNIRRALRRLEALENDK